MTLIIGQVIGSIILILKANFLGIAIQIPEGNACNAIYAKCQIFPNIHLDNYCQAVFIPLSIVRLPEIQYLIPSSLDSHSSIFQQVGKLLWGTELYWIIVLQQKTYPELHVCLVVVLPLAQVTLQIRVPTLHRVANNYQ